MNNRWDRCFYTNPDCEQEPTHAVSEFDVDLWISGHFACDEHLQYIVNCIEKKWHNNAEIKKL